MTKTDPESSGSDDKKNLKDLTRAELRAFVADELGEPAFRGDQLFRWIWARGARSFEEMTDLGRALRARLAGVAVIPTGAVKKRTPASDGTVKVLTELAGGASVETVWIPDWGPGHAGTIPEPDTPPEPGARAQVPRPSRITLCLSTQYGCAWGCRFCYTATMGLGRDLRAWEIADQVLVATREAPDALPTPVDPGSKPGDKGGDKVALNLVYMGMGEPLANLEATIRSIQILTDEQGLAIPPRRITVSTVGLVPAIERLIDETGVRLAVSLHATTDAQRDEIMPVNRKWKLGELLDAVRALPMGKRDHVTFEYILLAGVNDTPEDARRLVRLTHGLRAKVNLIPFNPHPGAPYARPSDEAVSAFKEALRDKGVHTYVRRARGDDVLAACGQLAGEGKVQRRPV